MTTMGHNEPAGGIAAAELRQFVERIEAVRERKKDCAEDEKLIFAELKARGFDAARVRDILKIRTQKPSDRQEAEAMLDTYLHAMGMASEAPLFRAIGAMSVDTAARETVIAAFKALVPTDGEVIVRMGGQPVRLYRDRDGHPRAEDYVEPAAPGRRKPDDIVPSPRREPPPDVDEAEARALGRRAGRDDEPVIANPFPFGDRRRPLWDEGWRAGAGGDGMGPDAPGDDPGDDPSDDPGEGG